ncbi:MAG TPA: hypothetical protein VJ901_20800 [Thermoanaerobaculia bacterium]|nr:hypothetical protein [Thermoanaerobaculia bacterium]
MNAQFRFCTLVLATWLVAPFAMAQSASGGFHVVTDDGTRNIEFNARVSTGGATSGEIKFSGPVTIPDQNVDDDGSGDVGMTMTTVSLRVDVDCLRIDGNRAALSGLVTDSNISAFVGRQMVLTVEDGGEGKNAAADRYTWGQYHSGNPKWTASDAELEFDPGVGLTWIATDAERTDDAGIPSSHSSVIDCHSFPLVSYALEDLAQGSGNIQVKP